MRAAAAGALLFSSSSIAGIFSPAPASPVQCPVRG